MLSIGIARNMVRYDKKVTQPKAHDMNDEVDEAYGRRCSAWITVLILRQAGELVEMCISTLSISVWPIMDVHCLNTTERLPRLGGTAHAGR